MREKTREKIQIIETRAMVRRGIEYSVGGRTFIIREMVAADQDDFLRKIIDLEAEDIPLGSEKLDLEKMNQKGKEIFAIISEILGEDENGILANEEFLYRNLNQSTVLDILDAQSRVNGLDELIRENEKKSLARAEKNILEKMKEMAG